MKIVPNKEDFIKHIHNKKSTTPHLRLGQIAFNEIYDLLPDVACKLRATEYDPFYNDDRTNMFIDKCYDMIYLKKVFDKIER